MRIRPAAASDWDAIWPFFEQIVKASETYPYDPAMTYEQGRDLWMFEPPGRTVVAEDAKGVVLGSATMGPNRPGPGSHIATASFMVDAAARGRGVGRALGEHVIGWAAGAGYHAMQFNAVVETNEVAVNLWLALGFEIVGTVPEAFNHPEHGYVGLHVMYRLL